MHGLSEIERMNLDKELKAQEHRPDHLFVVWRDRQLVSIVDTKQPGKSLDVPVGEPDVGLTFHSPGKSILPLSAEAQAFWDDVEGLPFK